MYVIQSYLTKREESVKEGTTGDDLGNRSANSSSNGDKSQ